MSNQIKIKDTVVNVGDTIRVFYKIIEKEISAGKTKKEKKAEVRERVQPFEGIVIAINGNTDNRSFIVRKIGVDNIGIERIFPAVSPWISKVSIKKKGIVRRAKLYYLRNVKPKDIKGREEKTTEPEKKIAVKAIPTPEKEKKADVKAQPAKTSQKG